MIQLPESFVNILILKYHLQEIGGIVKAEVASLNLNSFDISDRNGFLPDDDPLTELPPKLWYVDHCGKILPSLTNSVGCAIGNMTKTMPVPAKKVLNELTIPEARLAFNRYGHIASAFIHGQNPPVSYLPENIAVPLWVLSNRLNKPPILAYDSYVLYNWKRKDKNKPIIVDNLEVIQPFTSNSDEAWFILIHVNIEREAALALKNIVSSLRALQEHNVKGLNHYLQQIGDSIESMANVFLRMGEGTTPETYYRVRKWIMYFENITYHGVTELNSPQSFRGQTGAQDSAIKSLDAFLGVKHEENSLTRHLKEMYDYMPQGHRRFIGYVRNASTTRHFVINEEDESARRSYNRCVRQLYRFRDIHYNYAYRYIHQQTDNPIGTGGTHFLEWLEKLRDNTIAHIIP